MKICVYAICKNESQFVEKWLDSMQEADYIVVMDTGSTDGTFKMLKEDPRVTRVEKKTIKPWRFDVARNESMKLIPEDSDVLVCTDFDEVFEPGWAQVIRDNWIEGTDKMFYTYAWSHNEVGEPTDVFRYDKIHRPGKYHWIFPVHEVLYPIDGDNDNQQFLDAGDKIYLHHYPDKSKPRAYYFDLLKLSCKENPKDSHVRMLFAREYLANDDLDNAEKEFLKVLKMPDVETPEKREVLLYTLLHLAIIYQRKSDPESALWYCEEFIKEDRTFREPYLLMAEIYNTINIPTLAEACVNAAIEYAYQHNSWIEKGNTYTDWLPDVAAVSKYNLGKFQEAVTLGKEALKHSPNDERLIKNQYLYLTQYCKLLEEKLNQKSPIEEIIVS